MQSRSHREAARYPERTPASIGAAAGIDRDAQPQATSGYVLPSPSKPKASPAAGDDEVDSDEFDAYFADDSEDSDTDDDEEEEYIPGPDVEGEEELDDGILPSDQDFRPPTLRQSQVPEPDVVNERFERILRKCLEELVGWAKGLDFKAWRALPRAERSMSIGSWRILSRTSVDFLMKMFLSAYSLPVQNFVASDTWTLDAILALPDTFGDKRQGIYGNFPTGGPSRPQIGCEAYIGSAEVLDKRTYSDSRGHSAISRKYLPEELPKAHRGSLHYRDICRPGVRNNFRALSGFRHPVQRGYLYVLESINMILFGSYNDMGRYHNYASEASYDLVFAVRSSLGLPEVAWGGLNAAWPLYQGVPAKSVREASPCANKACGIMTYPKRLRPENSPKTTRRLLDAEDPLGQYVCGPCGSYHDRYLRMPDTAWGIKWREVWEQRRIRRAIIGEDARCHSCGVLESERPKKKCTFANGRVAAYPAAHSPHPLFPEVEIVFCSPCWSVVHTYGRVKTQEEVNGTAASYRHLHTSAFKADLREQNCKIICKSCGREETPDMYKKHTVVDGEVLCNTCENRRKKDIEARDLIGQDVRCDGCNKHRSELPKITVKNSKGIPKEYPGSLVRSKVLPGKTLCTTCHKFVNRHKRLKTAEELLGPLRPPRASKKSKTGN